MANHLHIDPFSGIAGDMFLGALVDLGLDLNALQAALAPLPIQRPYHIATQRVYRHGIGAVDLKVHIEGEHAHAHDDQHAHDHSHSHGHSHPHDHHHHHGGDDAGHAHHHDHGHPHDPHHEHPKGDAGHDHTQHHHHGDHHHPHEHVGYRQIMAMIDQLALSDRGRQRAQAVVTKLGQAEARVHGKPLDAIHFHEVGAVDSIVDMLGGVVALELLGIDSLSCGVLPISRGYIRCAHGLMPVPAPATAYLLEGLPTIGVDRQGELVTPTGAALVAGLCSHFGPPPAMTMRAVGYGAGDRDDPKVPNLLRLMWGTTGPAGTLGILTPAEAVAATPAS